MLDQPRRTRKQDTRWETQDLAFEAAADSQPTVALMLLASIRECPSTCDELEQRHALTHQTCSAAVNWLMRRNLIVTDSLRVTRSNRMARVWRESLPGEANRPTRRDLRAELAAMSLLCDTLRTERDEARRMYCRQTADSLQHYTEPERIAMDRGWDCFKEDGK
jgi:hypothetical protein